MIPVFQDKFGEYGNCLSACVASILELPLRGVPHFVSPSDDEGSWFGKMYAFLHTHGFEIVPFYMGGTNPKTGILYRDEFTWAKLPEHLQGMYEYQIVCGPAARGFSHATVGWRGQIIHDPHPSKSGLIEVDEYYFLKAVSK